MLELRTFIEMFSDKALGDFEKMYHKYGKENFFEFTETLKKSFYTPLSIADFNGNPCVLLNAKINLTSQLKKSLLGSYGNREHGIAAMEDEIISTLSIESIDTSRDSVRRILNGGTPNGNNESKAYGIKRGFDFISDIFNKITESNLYTLYRLSVGNFSKNNDRTTGGNYYRHDSVYATGDHIAHTGLPHHLLSRYMDKFIIYMNTDDDLDQIIKSIVIHYYFAYLHPYFDGNGRMARLVQLWYLVQKGYPQALFIPFSNFINASRTEYYKAFEQIGKNQKISGVLDVTPFISFFISNIFVKLNKKVAATNTLDYFNQLLQMGAFTPEEKQLFEFVVSTYGYNEFSTKQLEKDFGFADHATIWTFVLEFEKNGLLSAQKCANRVKYKII